jgi:hypothetical protein
VGLALVALMGAMPMGAAILGAGYGRPDALFADQPSSTSGPGGEKAASPAAQGPPALPSGAIDKTAALRDCRAAYYTLRLADALAACERAVQADPLFIDARLDLGWVLLESGRTDDALVKAMTTEPLASTDAQRREALVLQVAVHTVRGEVVLAMAKLDRATGLGGKKGMEAGARLGVLRKGRVSEAWMRHILPRYACWAKKGDREAGEYLLRRGVTDRRMFLRALGKLDPAQREKLEGEGRSRCPW